MLNKIIRTFKNNQRNILGHKNSIKTGVLLPLVYNEEQQLCILFEKRALNMKRQPGEICFPGGSQEKSDSSLQETAVRETCEELGLLSEDITIIADLDIFLTPFNFMVYPILSFIKTLEHLNPNPHEVEKILLVPVDYLQACEPRTEKIRQYQVFDKDFPFELIPQGRDYPFRAAVNIVYFFQYKNEVIWGLTARILNDFLERLKDSH
ncbi:MAG: CoA pyrophosphatase [Syntrophomonadaceae bacterium]|nr:CoA pyrophosphatase [Syntrophomonadaceae bacterium]